MVAKKLGFYRHERSRLCTLQIEYKNLQIGLGFLQIECQHLQIEPECLQIDKTNLQIGGTYPKRIIEKETGSTPSLTNLLIFQVRSPHQPLIYRQGIGNDHNSVQELSL